MKPSIPIIWFGDLERYKKSPKKIVTIGINPSKEEFPVGKPFSRFPKAENFYAKDTLNDTDKDNLFLALNEYFKEKPYDTWFDYYEKVLNSFDASYKKRNNIAINIDICTAIATNPLWRGLKSTIKKQYENSLVNDLLAYLDPDIILYSGDKIEFSKYFNDYKFIQGFTRNIEKNIESFDSLKEEERYGLHGSRRPYIRLYIKDEKFLVWGKYRDKPFNIFTDKEKQEIILPSIRNYFT